MRALLHCHYLLSITYLTCSLGALHVQASDAMSHVAGYTVAHDVNARDWQMYKNGKQWLLGKSFDTFCPLGPALVTTPTLSGTPHDAFLHSYMYVWKYIVCM